MNQEIINKIVIYVVWWIICTSRMLICRLIKIFALIIMALTIIDSDFHLGVILGILLIIHPIYVSKIFKFFKQCLISRYTM